MRSWNDGGTEIARVDFDQRDGRENPMAAFRSERAEMNGVLPADWAT
jgi:hypothetical protein